MYARDWAVKNVYAHNKMGAALQVLHEAGTLTLAELNEIAPMPPPVTQSRQADVRSVKSMAKRRPEVAKILADGTTSGRTPGKIKAIDRTTGEVSEL